MDDSARNPDQPPPDEVWWERELHRNEKLVDKFIASLEEAEGEDEQDAESEEIEASEVFDEATGEQTEEMEEALETLWQRKAISPEADDDDDDTKVSDNFTIIHKQATEFGIRVMRLENLSDDASILFLSAGKIAANLAGGHGLGYDEQMLCGNIVKCRWALSDCEFCGQMLEFFHKQTNHPALAELTAECGRLATAIRGRVERLRARAWWQRDK